MGRIVAVVVGVVVLLVVAALAAPMLIPASAYKARIEAEASRALGREVTLGEDLSFRLFPRAAFHVSDLVVANAEGMSAPYLLSVGSADIGVRLLPLFGGEVEIDRFVLDQPDIRLETNAEGEGNWTLGDGAAPTEAPEDSDEARELNDLRLGDVRVVDGRVSYKDGVSGAEYLAEDVDVTVGLESLVSPLTVAGSAVFQGAPATVDLRLDTPAALQRGETAALDFSASLPDTNASADLDVVSSESLRYEGTVDLRSDDLRALAALFDAPIEAEQGFERLAVSGALSGDDAGATFEDAKVVFDDIAGAGRLRIGWAGPRPTASGALALDALDLRPYMPAAPEDDPEAAFPPWSDEPIDFSGLKAADVDFELETGAILLPTMKIDESALTLTIENGLMTADLTKFALYGGSGGGRLRVDARQGTPALDAVFDLAGLDAAPFAADAMNVSRISGVGDLKLDAAMRGASQADWVESLDGEASFSVKDGAIKGANLGKIVRSLSNLSAGLNQAALAGALSEAQGESAETDFTDFTAALTAADGVLTAQELALVGPYVRLTGGGTVNLPAQRVDLKLRPLVSAEAEAESGRTIPLALAGDFASPKLTLDTQGAVRRSVEEAVGGKVRDLLRPKSEDDAAEEGDDAAQEQSVEEAAGAALNSLFGRKKKSEEEEDGGGGR